MSSPNTPVDGSSQSNQSPFRYPQETANFATADINTFIGRPEYIVRKWIRYQPGSDEREAGIDSAKEFKSLLHTLEEDYGIENSGATYVVGRDVDDQSMESQYLVTNRVNGVNLRHDMSTVPESVTLGVMHGIVGYYKTVVANGGGLYSRSEPTSVYVW